MGSWPVAEDPWAPRLSTWGGRGAGLGQARHLVGLPKCWTDEHVSGSLPRNSVRLLPRGCMEAPLTAFVLFLRSFAFKQEIQGAGV